MTKGTQYDLLNVIDYQIDFLKRLAKIDYGSLYDQFPEHKITAVTTCLKTIESAQAELQKQIKT